MHLLGAGQWARYRRQFHRDTTAPSTFLAITKQQENFCFCLEAKSCRPACSQSLYWLICQGSFYVNKCNSSAVLDFNFFFRKSGFNTFSCRCNRRSWTLQPCMWRTDCPTQCSGRLQLEVKKVPWHHLYEWRWWYTLTLIHTHPSPVRDLSRCVIPICFTFRHKLISDFKLSRWFGIGLYPGFGCWHHVEVGLLPTFERNSCQLWSP
jgi:hypothetical protein